MTAIKETPQPLRPGSHVGRYIVSQLIARGGMGEVWLADSRGPGNFCKKVVIKTIRPELAEQPSYVTMLINEASLVARLHHPNIVQVFDLACVDGLYYIAMEYVPGCTLSQLLQRFAQMGSPIPQWAALHVAATCCDGLQYAHDFREDDGTPVCILHRDVSPSNVMITRAGNVVVLDFGVATAASGPERTRTGTLKGKYSYMAPERVNGADADRRSDVYSVGVLLYQLLTGGHKPYSGDSEYGLLKAIIQGNAKPPSAHSHHVPPDIDAVTMRAIAHDPMSRYAEARYLADALRAIAHRRQWNYGASDLGQLISDLAAATGSITTPAPTPRSHSEDDLGTLLRDLPRSTDDGPSEVSFEIVTETEDSAVDDAPAPAPDVEPAPDAEPDVAPAPAPDVEPAEPQDAIPRHIARARSTRPNIFPEPTETRAPAGDVFSGYVRHETASDTDRWPWGGE